MSTDRFRTVSSDLQALAEKAERFFASLGYSVKAEPAELGLPATPALKCKRHQTTVFVNIGREDLVVAVKNWIAYCKSSGRDSRVCLVIPADCRFGEVAEDGLREKGIGVLRNGGKELTEIIQHRDLAINMELPELANCSVKGKRLLGAAYEKFGRGDWHGCFDEACRALENLARKNLIEGVRMNRIVVLGKMCWFSRKWTAPGRANVKGDRLIAMVL